MKRKNYNLVSCILFTVIFFINQNTNAQMFWNQACSFPSVDSEHVSVRHSSSLNITGSYTMEAWVNPVNVASPPFQIIMQKRASGSDGYTMYISNGKVALRNNSSTRLTGSAVIPNNTWTHIAGTYNLVTGSFKVYINGELDTSSVVAGVAPVTNTDSLLIGKGSNSPFKGQMDEVRIWNRELLETEIYNFKRTTLGSDTGPYEGLVMSLTFQDNDANGADFSLTDWSGNSNSGNLRGASAVDLSNRPLQTIQMNDCIELAGSQDYLTGPDNANVSPTTQLTLSAWIYLRSNTNSIIIHKGSPGGGAGTNYRLSITSSKLAGAINGNFLTTDDTIPLHQWTYVAFTYLASLGGYQFHMNGDLVYQGSIAPQNITDGTDSLYIGGSLSLLDFDGYIDEARIIPDVKYTETINNFMFKSIDLSNGGAGSYAIYNFDGYANNNGGSSVPVLRFNGDSSGFAHCGSINDQPQSPMDRADDVNFQNGFQLKKSFKRIPPAGFSGTTIDSFKILQNVTISDINVFVTLNHNEEQELQLHLIAPNGDIALLYNNNSVVFNADHVTTIFDDQADSSIVNGRYVSFSPRIKPAGSINTQFSGDNSSGYWRLSVRDVATSGVSDSGILYGWGIQINNQSQKPYLLNTANTIQGFYRPASNNMVRDTMRYYLRNTELPYGIYDSAKVFVTNQGFAQLNLANVSSGVALYIQLKHRNSIETWSNPIYYDALSYQAEYSFLNPVTQAYGSNMIQVDNTPLVFAIYSGDVNQDGVVDVTDVSRIENEAINFTSGYVVTDVNGDNFVDLEDQTIADNNSYNFVEKSVPPGALVNSNPDDYINSDQSIIINTGDPNISNSVQGNENKTFRKNVKSESEKINR